MTDVVELGGKKAYVDRTLRNNLDDMKADIRKDDDVVIIVDGKERIGKSVLAQLCGWYLSDGKLAIEDICLTPEEFAARIKRAEKYDVIIFDECFLGLAASDWMNKYNRLLKKMLVTVGQKNLVLILVLPSVFDISKYVALHRADCLLHCFKHKGQRGHFAFYNHRKLQQVYIYGKKTYSYWRPKPAFARKFTNFYAVSEVVYRNKKSNALNKFLDSDEEEVIGRRSQLMYNAIKAVALKLGLTKGEAAKLIGCSDRTIGTAKKLGKLNKKVHWGGIISK